MTLNFVTVSRSMRAGFPKHHVLLSSLRSPFRRSRSPLGQPQVEFEGLSLLPYGEREVILHQVDHSLGRELHRPQTLHWFALHELHCFDDRIWFRPGSAKGDPGEDV
jgi:hypothetical protein